MLQSLAQSVSKVDRLGEAFVDEFGNRGLLEDEVVREDIMGGVGKEREEDGRRPWKSADSSPIIDGKTRRRRTHSQLLGPELGREAPARERGAREHFWPRK